jgi:hypothetical protein
VHLILLPPLHSIQSQTPEAETSFTVTNTVEPRLPEGKRPLGRHRHRWEDNIKKDIQKLGCGGMDWIELAQDRDRWQALVNVVTKLRVP